jgi:hypothetical protein
MEFFERIEQIGHLRPSPTERATKMLATLADALAEAPSPGEVEPGTYGELYCERLGRAKRAYERGLEAIALDDVELCLTRSESGLLQLELGLRHLRTLKGPLAAAAMDLPLFEGGGCEEQITKLGDAIGRIKQFVEYKGLVPAKSLKERLAIVVQSFQDAIENYARADHATAYDIATIGLIWSQYIYARLSADTLLAPAQQLRRLRPLYQFAHSAGQAGSEPVCARSDEGQVKITNLEKFLQSSIVAYFDNDIIAMDKFIQLGEIEAGALLKYAARAAGSFKEDESADNHSGPAALESALAAATADDGMESGPEKGSLKRLTAAIRRLIERHHPKPHKALVALRELQSNSVLLRRAMRQESWQEANRLLDLCQAEKQILLRETEKMTD